MINDNVFYVDAKTKIVDFLNSEFAGFPVKLQNRFLNFFSLIIDYEEEGHRYKPSLLFTDDISRIVKGLPHPSKIEMFCDDNENMFSSRIRALTPFCKYDWYVYVEVREKITYGILRNVSSIKDPILEDIIFSNQYIRDRGDKISAFLCYAENNWTVSMRSLKGNKLFVNFALDIMGHNDIDTEIANFVDATFSKLKTTAKKLGELKNLVNNIFKRVLQEVNGTICVVVDKDYARDAFLDDGIWLKEPISLSKSFMQTQNYSEQNLTAIADLFLSMLNKDGITVVDNTGQILAYNVFVETDMKQVGNIIGGARKRAAYTIINSRKKDIVGVYFQSFDGEVFFAPVKK